MTDQDIKTADPAKRPPKKRKISSGIVTGKHQWKAWLYLAPAIVLLLIFTGWPIINTVSMAFMENYNSLAAIGGQTFSFGIKNFF